MHRKLQMIFGIAKSEKVEEEPIQDGLLNVIFMNIFKL